MADETWQELRTRVEGLGSKLKVHLEQEHDAEDSTTQPGDTRAAFEEMTSKLQDALTSFQNAGRDPFVREDMRDIGNLLKDALNDTYQSVSENVRKTKGEMADGVGDADIDGDADSTDGGNDA